LEIAGAPARTVACGRSATTPTATSAKPVTRTNNCSASNDPRERGRRAAISVMPTPSSETPDGRRCGRRRQSPVRGAYCFKVVKTGLRRDVDLRSLQTARIVDVDRLPLG